MLYKYNVNANSWLKKTKKSIEGDGIKMEKGVRKSLDKISLCKQKAQISLFFTFFFYKFSTT